MEKKKKKIENMYKPWIHLQTPTLRIVMKNMFYVLIYDSSKPYCSCLFQELWNL